ncbi:hypothetical protein G7Y89_g10280 [Cudoniella acicularis]|uniref:Uncharacterized protein n=1 Tax=Cudoniella acicularis TaxID=354080 RepID=A0A8H4W141_9HELO|nr:hypothetical protein G7Y89_g10280 [Cudoniella acicularis]
MDFAGKMPSIGLLADITQETPGGTLCSTLEYPPIILNKLLAACREDNLSITSALHAAVIVATQEFQEMSSESSMGVNFTTFAIFDYRPYMPAPCNDVSAWPMGVYMLGLPASLPSAEFPTQAKALQKVYKQPLGQDEFPVLEYYDQYSGMMASALSQPPPPRMPLPTTLSLSGLGSIDCRMQAIYEGKKRCRLRVSRLERMF